MDAIVLAGGVVAPDDALHAQAPGGLKCLIEVAGKPLVQWSLDALGSAAGIERVVVVGLPSTTALRCDLPLTRLPGAGDLIGSIQAATEQLLRERPGAGHALIVSADAPLVTAEMLTWMVERVRERDEDLSMAVVERSVMEARFPASRRTYVRLKETEVCGGDVNACRLSVARPGDGIAERLSKARKSPLRLASIIGLDTLGLLLLRRLTLTEAMARVSARLRLRVGAIVCPHAEVAMDVDKPGQLELVRAALEARA